MEDTAPCRKSISEICTMKYALSIAVACLTAIAAGLSAAADLALDITGIFGPTTTLGGNALGAATPFAFRAVFDANHELFHTPGAGIFAVIEFTITIDGHGTFTGVPNANLNAVVVDQTYHVGTFAAGLVDLTATSFFLNKYQSVSTPFSPPTPTPTNFLNYLGRESGVFPYTIPLAGGAGNLAINDFGSSMPSASLVAVPEPTTLMLSGILATVLLAAIPRHASSHLKPSETQSVPRSPHRDKAGRGPRLGTRGGQSLRPNLSSATDEVETAAPESRTTWQS
jgi:hypothetical protein